MKAMISNQKLKQILQVFFVFFTVLGLCSTVSYAQKDKGKEMTTMTPAMKAPKFGYVAADQIVFALPETRRVDSLLRQYKADSIDALLPYILSEYNRKDSISKIEKNAIIKKQTQAEASQLRQQLENWSQISQAKLQEKQNQLLAPLYQKVSDVINDLAKKENYTYIFRAESLLYAPEGDNLSEKVLHKLGITFPHR